MLSANLIPAFTGRLPAVLPPTGVTHINVQLTNAGVTQDTEPVTVRLYASTDRTLDGSDLSLASLVRNVRLKPEGRTTFSITTPAPTSLPDGNYFLLAQVDGSSTVASSTRTIAFQNPFSDTAITFGQLPSQPIEIDGRSAGRRCATVNISNTGNIAERGKVTVNFYLAADATLDAADPLLATVANKSISLKPGAHQAVSFKISVPPGTAVGGYFLFATMTPAASLSDTNASNNTAVSSQRVAVVNRLPRPARNHDHSNSYNDISYVDQTDYAYYPDPGDYEDPTDTSTPSDIPTNTDSNPPDTTQPSAPTDDSQDNAPPDASSSDSSPTDDSSDYYTSGGDF